MQSLPLVLYLRVMAVTGKKARKRRSKKGWVGEDEVPPMYREHFSHLDRNERWLVGGRSRPWRQGQPCQPIHRPPIPLRKNDGVRLFFSFFLPVGKPLLASSRDQSTTSADRRLCCMCHALCKMKGWYILPVVYKRLSVDICKPFLHRPPYS